MPDAWIAIFQTQGRHVLEEWQDLGEEMSHVQGAVVIRRPDLIDPSSTSSLLAPAVDLDFVTTLQSYFPLFESSLFSRYGRAVNRGSCCRTQTSRSLAWPVGSF